MEQGPVLVIMFQSQQIMVVRDLKGTVVEGDPVSTAILKLNNVVSKSKMIFLYLNIRVIWVKLSYIETKYLLQAN